MLDLNALIRRKCLFVLMKQLKDRLASTVIYLAADCPYDHCNPDYCPLFNVRQMPLEERVEWICGLNLEDLEYITNYHHVCLQWRSATDPTSVIKVVCSWCGTILQEGFEPPSHGVCVDCFKLVFSTVFQSRRIISATLLT